MSRNEAIRLDKLRSEAHERADSQTPFGIVCRVATYVIVVFAPWFIMLKIYAFFGGHLHPAWMRIFGWLTGLLMGVMLIGRLWQWIREK
jgi:hypothetical protein